MPCSMSFFIAAGFIGHGHIASQHAREEGLGRLRTGLPLPQSLSFRALSLPRHSAKRKAGSNRGLFSSGRNRNRKSRLSEAGGKKNPQQNKRISRIKCDSTFTKRRWSLSENLSFPETTTAFSKTASYGRFS